MAGIVRLPTDDCQGTFPTNDARAIIRGDMRSGTQNVSVSLNSVDRDGRWSMDVNDNS
jgi:hypothetical protein